MTRRVFVYYLGYEAPCHVSDSMTPDEAKAECGRWNTVEGVQSVVVRDRFGGEIPA